MSAVPITTRYTEEEYLALEREAEYKSEYIDGQIIAMTGASAKHNLITTNVVRELSTQLKSRPCRVFSNDMRVRVSAPSRSGYFYPDVVVACGEPQVEDDHGDTLLNPVLIVEVLSPSTEAYDRSKKFVSYRRLHSLEEYVLISQDEPRIERYARRGEEWILTEVSSIGDAIQLTSVGCSLAINEVFDKVEF